MKRLFLSATIVLCVISTAFANTNDVKRAALPDHVSYLCKAQWSKNTAPFRDLCPIVDGVHCDAGCIAISMAQLMYYYQYPTSGTGIVSTRTQGAVMKSIDLSETTFDYANMLKRYDGSYTEAQGIAAATLVAACGYSVKMQYGVGFSGAYIEDQCRALINNFNYSSSAKIYTRTAWSDEAWKNRIREELAAGRPILISAYHPTLGGHSFMCDGYYSDDTFHINWGWGPTSGGAVFNGRYDILKLNPTGSESGYTDNQQFIMGIKPMKEGEDRSFQYNIIIDGAVSSFSINGNDLSFTLPSLLNSSLTAANGTIYYAVYNSNDEKVDEIFLTTYSAKALSYGYAPGSSIKAINTTIPYNLKDGEYYLKLEFKPNDSDKSVAVETGDTKAVLHITVANEQISAGDVVASGIESVTTYRPDNSGNTKTYNLQGQQVDDTRHGLFIRNGKKILIK